MLVPTRCPECIHQDVCRLSENYIKHIGILGEIPNTGEDFEFGIRCKHHHAKVKDFVTRTSI